MKIVDGLWKYGETVAIDIDGELIKRKVRYADGELYVNYGANRLREKDLEIKPKFDRAAYINEYMSTKRDRISITAQKGTKDTWKQAASDVGMSLNAFVIYCVEKEIHG